MTSPTIYHDCRYIYLEFPTYALRFDRTQDGLAKALKHIPKIEGACGQVTGATNLVDRETKAKPGHIARKTLSKTSARKREVKDLGEAAKRGAAEIIRKFNFGDN